MNPIRCQGFGDQERPKSLAHLVGLIMQRIVCDASVALRGSFVTLATRQGREHKSPHQPLAAPQMRHPINVRSRHQR